MKSRQNSSRAPSFIETSISNKATSSASKPNRPASNTGKSSLDPKQDRLSTKRVDLKQDKLSTRSVDLKQEKLNTRSVNLKQENLNTRSVNLKQENLNTRSVNLKQENLNTRSVNPKQDKLSTRRVVAPKQDQPRTKSVNLKLQQTLATAVTNPTNRRGHPGITPAVSSKSYTKPTISQEEIEHLASQFEKLTSSVLNLASTPKALGARSLEALLTREVTNHLGQEVNSPKFSQRFIQATRGLLDNLVCLYEEGKLNPHLLKDQRTARQSFLEAKSSTNVCYRDKYLKELLMNVLKSMSSNELEEEVSRAGVQVRSAASRERVLAIRDIVRAEAGLEPETFKELDRKLAELRRSLSQNQLEMLRAAREVERVISEQLLSHSSRADCVNITGAAAREVFRGDIGSSEKNNNSVTPKNSLNFEKIKSQTFVPFNVHDPMENIKPYIAEIVQKELNRAKEKRSHLLNKGRFTVEVVSSQECANSADNLDLQDDVEDYEDDAEINEEETRIFLEALKFDIEQKRINLTTEISECLEPIDENKDYVEEENRNILMAEYRNDLVSSSGRIIEGTGNCDNPYRPECAQESNTFDLPSNLNFPKRIQSIWSSDDSVENNIVRDMREVFEKLKYKPENLLTTGSCVKNNKFDFTVDEMEKILKNVALKIEQIPVIFESPEFMVSTGQQQQLFNILNTMGILRHGSYMGKVGALQCLSQDAQFLTSLQSASKSFSFLSKALHSAPDQVRACPFSALNPPSSLTTTLVFLASSEHFKDCFTTVLTKENPLKLDFGDKSDTTLKEPFIRNAKQTKIELIHQIIADLRPRDMGSPTVDAQEESTKLNSHFKSRNAFNNSAEDIEKHISSFEHYLGLTPSVMTVQNISDMFIFLSTVLNEVPDRVKQERIATLNPPASFLRALSILYEEDDHLTDIDKSSNFDSLTVQDVSNFFLTISKALQETPGRVRHSSVQEMDPPKSLLKAINLLTSLSHISILESRSEEEIEDIQETHPQEKPQSGLEPDEQPQSDDQERPQSSHERFFDAVDSLTSLRPPSR